MFYNGYYYVSTAVAVAQSGGGCVMRARVTVTQMTRSPHTSYTHLSSSLPISYSFSALVYWSVEAIILPRNLGDTGMER